MPTYRKKPVSVEAYRWQPGIQLPGIDEVDVEEPAFIEARLAQLLREYGITEVVHGASGNVDLGAARCADALGERVTPDLRRKAKAKGLVVLEVRFGD